MSKEKHNLKAIRLSGIRSTPEPHQIVTVSFSFSFEKKNYEKTEEGSRKSTRKDKGRVINLNLKGVAFLLNLEKRKHRKKFVTVLAKSKYSICTFSQDGQHQRQLKQNIWVKHAKDSSRVKLVSNRLKYLQNLHPGKLKR